MGLITTAITLHPATWAGGVYSGVTNTSRPIGKGTGATSPSYVYLTSGAGAETYAFWGFDCSDLPPDADIKSVSCSAHCYTSLSNTGYILTQTVNLYTAATVGGTGVGTAQNLTTSSSSVLAIPGGSWTREQLTNGCYIGFYAKRGTGGATASRYNVFYGADLVITYETNWVISSTTLTPATYLGVTNGTVSNSNRPIGQGVTNNYPAQINHGGTNIGQQQTYAFWGFNTEDIPNNAQIDSVTCRVRTNFSQQDTAFTKTVGMYSATNLKGSSVTVNSNQSNSIFDITNTGTWTRGDLYDCRIGFITQKTNNVTYSSYPYFQFYGAELTINYHYSLVTYEVTVENNSVPAIVYPEGTVAIGEGEWGGFTVSPRFITIPLDITKIKITDNGNTLPLTSLTEYQFTDSIDFVGTKLTTFNSSSSVTSPLSVNVENACDSIDSKSYAKLVGDSNHTTNQYHYVYDFGNITIPQDAIDVLGVSLGIKAERYENSDWGAVVLCNGVGTPLMISAITSGNSSGAPVATGSLITMGYTEEVVSFPLTGMNLSLALIPIVSPEQGSGNPVLFLYGAYIEIEFLTSNGHTYTEYVYDNYPSEDHTYVFEDIGEIFYQRRSNTWIESSWKGVYKKINNAWVQQETLEGVFQDDEVYFTGSTGDITTVQFGVNGILKQNDE